MFHNIITQLPSHPDSHLLVSSLVFVPNITPTLCFYRKIAFAVPQTYITLMLNVFFLYKNRNFISYKKSILSKHYNYTYANLNFLVFIDFNFLVSSISGWILIYGCVIYLWMSYINTYIRNGKFSEIDFLNWCR